MEIHNINMKFSFYGLITRNLSLICIPRIVFMKTPRVSGEGGEERRGERREGRGGGEREKNSVGEFVYTIKIDIPLNHPAPLIILIDSKTRRGVAVLRKSIFIFLFFFFFHATKIPYNDKSWLFDRGFPDRAVYFTYKVTRWITRTIFCLVAGVLYF